MAKKSIALFRLINIVVGPDPVGSKPFGLCMKHEYNYKLPNVLILEKIANESLKPCIFCEQEATDD